MSVIHPLSSPHHLYNHETSFHRLQATFTIALYNMELLYFLSTTSSLLLPFIFCCSLLLSALICFYLHSYVAYCSHVLLSALISCYLQSSVAICTHILLSAVFHFYLQSSVAICTHLKQAVSSVIYRSVDCVHLYNTIIAIIEMRINYY